MSSTIPPTFEARDFRKASASEPHKDCVEVARRDGWVEIRDDKTIFGAPDDRRLVLTAEEFDRFQAGVRSGMLGGLCLEMIRLADGTHAFHSTHGLTDTELRFADTEVAAFLAGVRAGEFDLAAYATA